MRPSSKTLRIWKWMNDRKITRCHIEGELWSLPRDYDPIKYQSHYGKRDAMESYRVKFSDGALEYVVATSELNAATLARAKKVNADANYSATVVFVEKSKPGDPYSFGPVNAFIGHGFVNLFLTEHGKIQAGGVYPTRDIANAISQPTRFDCVPIHWTPCANPVQAYKDLQNKKSAPFDPMNEMVFW